MAQEIIGIGAAPNDGTGDPVRSAFGKCNDNFTELYAGPGGKTFDTDGTLAANSDTRVPSQKAVKTAIAAAVLGMFDLRGSTDCSANPNYPSAVKGDTYVVTVAGKIGGASGTSVGVGDIYFATADNAGGTQAAVGASWDVILHAGTLSGALIAANSLSDVTSAVAAKDNISKKGADIASAATTDLSTATGDFVNVTGTTTITSLGTCAAGVQRTVKFTGALTLTYNATSLILPTAANIATAAGDTAVFRSLGSGNWLCVGYQRASGAALTGSGGGSGNAWNLQWGPLQNEAPATNYAPLDSRNGHALLKFDPSTAWSAVFTGVMPSDYSGAGITVSVFFAVDSGTTGNVCWQAALERIDASDQSLDSDGFATAQSFSAAAVPGTNGQIIKASLNISNGANMDSIAAGELFRLKITRDAANASDTAAGNAQLLRATMVSQ